MGAIAAKKAGDLVLEVNPGLLVIIEGLEYAGNLEGARQHPILLNRPGQLVYSGHEYTFWGDTSKPYQEVKQHMEDRQTFVREAGHQYSTAYWMGETGTGSNDNDWGKIIRFLQKFTFHSRHRKLMLIGATGQLMGTSDQEKTKVLGSYFLTIRLFATLGCFSSYKVSCHLNSIWVSLNKTFGLSKSHWI